MAIFLCEALGLLALFLAPEVDQKFLLVLVAVGLGARLFGLRLPDRLLLVFIAGIIFTGLGFGAFGSLAIASLLTRSMVPVHALLWLAGTPRTYRYWRLGIGFLEIVLASILSPETHMFLIIFAFVLTAALALSFGFLERNFSVRNPEGLKEPVNGSFLGAVVALSFLIFLSSLLIFPLLPRSNWSGLGRSWAEPGYTEVVSFRGTTLSWAEGNSRPLVWVFLPEGANWQEVVPYGLLRGKVLESFDGLEWRSGSKQMSRSEHSTEGRKVEIYREPMLTDILPVPYGTGAVDALGRKREQFNSGEWPAPAMRNRRIQYEVYLGGGSNPGDLPKKVHLKMPDPKIFPKLLELGAQLSKGTRNDLDRVKKVSKYLEGYKAKLVGTESALTGTQHPVEHFLFDSKEGHCELFATAAALLFRSMGMPSRLVAGFRGTLPAGTVYSVKNTDAHAWVEVWTKESGWYPIDPTPFLESPGSWTEIFSDAYEYVNAYWHRYILGYEFDPRTLFYWISRQQLPRGLILAAAVCILAAGLFLRRKKKAKLKGERSRVTEAWIKLERQWRKRPDFLASSEGKKLQEYYLQLRFGREFPDQAATLAFSLEGNKVIKEFFAAARAEKAFLSGKNSDLPPPPNLPEK